MTGFGEKYTHVLYHISSVTFRYEFQVKEREQGGEDSEGILFMEALLKDSPTGQALESGCGLVQGEPQGRILHSRVQSIKKFIRKMHLN